MPQPRAQVLRTAAVLGVLALAAPPVYAGRVAYALPETLPEQAAGMVDPARAYFAPGFLIREAGLGRTPDGAFPRTSGDTRRAYRSFYTPAAAPDRVVGAFPDTLYPANGPDGLIWWTATRRPLRILTAGDHDPLQKDFPDPAGMFRAAEGLGVDGHDRRSALRGVIRKAAQAPEPPTLTLFTLGALGLLGGYCRQRRVELS